MSNLSEMDNREELIQTFVNYFNHNYPELELTWHPDNNKPASELVLEAGKYGNFQVSETLSKNPGDLKTLKEAIKLLTTLLEKLEYEEKINTPQNHDNALKIIDKHTPDLIARFDKNFKHIYANNNLEKFTSLRPEEAIGKTFRDLQFPAPICKYWENAIRQVFQTKNQLDDQFEFTSDKGTFVFNWRLIPEFNDKNEVSYVLSILRDITQRIELESKYQNLFSRSPVGIFIYDSKGNIRDANKKLIDILGSPSIEETAKINVFSFHPLKKSGISEDLKQCMENGETISKVRHYTSKWGKVLYLKYNISPLTQQNGKPMLCQVIIEDFTEQKRIELELKESKEKAEESDRLKSAFLANMSHEIRTPMNGIIGFAQLLKEKEFPHERQKQFLDIIHYKTTGLLQLIDDIIDISKIEAKEMVISEANFSLNNLLFNIYDNYLLEIENSGKDIQLEVEKELTNEAAYVHADVTRLEQILENLLSNSLKFTEKGKISFGYTLHNNSELLFHVSDTGIGIAENQIPGIFNRFRQVDGSSTRRFGGTGLGLAICKSLVELMRGKIWVESAVEEGSTFYFTIPYKPAGKKDKKQSINYSYKTIEWPEQTILILEDDPISAEFLEEVISETKARTLTAGCYYEAISLYEQYQSEINLMLVDIQLPDKSGLEFIKQIRQENTYIPIIAQTAYTLMEDRKKCLSVGANDYITKPIDMKTMIALIDKYLPKERKIPGIDK
jgi:PAS domain S-box-containing protein